MVFSLWFVLGSDDPFMTNNFLVSWDLLLQRHWWVLITSVFSHVSVIHILINMVVLRDFGSVMERVMGWKSFTVFYFVAGVVASLSHAVVSAFLIGRPDMPALGASGAVAGVVLVFSLLFRRQKILVLGFIPVPALVGAMMFIALDLWGLSAQVEGGGLPIGHGAHLGGAFTGIVWYFLFLKGRRSVAMNRIFMEEG